jgi:DNA-binding CsgD family transcriptional regulator
MADQHPVLKLWGRSSECELLEELVADVREGRSRAWVLRGEAGIGKTALLDYLSGVASACQVVRIAGIESEMELAYAGLHQLCTSMLGGMDQLAIPHRDALQAAFGLQAGPAPDRFMVGLAILGLLSQAAEEQPQLCLIDDAQWLDKVSAQTLTFVARRLLAERVGLVFALRGSSDARILSGLPEFTVGALRDGDARALLDAELRTPLDERVAERIVAETRGNPLALIELPRGMTPEQLAGGFGLPDSVPLASGIERSFAKRLAALTPRARKFLLAAAADPVGDVTLLKSAADHLGLGIEVADEAESAGLIEVRSRVRFRHPLVRSAVYQAASASDRREIHRALADATDCVFDPDRRAWHRAHAATGPDEEVARELEASADRARARGGAAAAAAFLERAAALSPDPSRRAERGLAAASAKRDAGALDAATALLVTVQHGPPDERRAAEVARLRGQIALDLQRGSDAARYLLNAARALESRDIQLARQIHLEALGAAVWAEGLDANHDLVVEAARSVLAAPSASLPPRPMDLVLDALALRFVDGFTAAAPGLIRALDALIKESLDREAGRWLWAAGNNLGGIIALELFDSEARYSLGLEQVEAARDTGALTQLQVGLHYLAHTNLPSGELTVAARQIEESCSISDATGNSPVAYTELALAAFRGREAEASELIERTMRTARSNGQGRIVSFATYTRAVLSNGIGHYDAARDAARQLIERDVIGYGPLVVGELAEAASRTGDVGLLDDALDWMRERTASNPTHWSTGIQTRIQALSTEGEDADSLYRESITRFGQTRLRAELARGHLLYGEWLRRERRRADARTQLAIASDMLTAMGLEGFARRAGRELLATGATVRKRSVGIGEELTAQEEHVARLASDGLSNPEIAARLFLSPRTVEYHLRKAFTKLGISSRMQLRAALTRGNETQKSS